MVLNIDLLPEDILFKVIQKIDKKTILKLIKFNDININKIIFNEINIPPLYFGNYYHVGASYITLHPDFKNNNDINDKKIICCNCNYIKNEKCIFNPTVLTRTEYKKYKDRQKITKIYKDFKNNCNTDYTLFNFCGSCGYLFWDQDMSHPAFSYIYYKNKFYEVHKYKNRRLASVF